MVAVNQRTCSREDEPVDAIRGELRAWDTDCRVGVAAWLLLVVHKSA